ncbi:hypothetical protein ACRAWD_17655 [Caulobacter segnis]
MSAALAAYYIDWKNIQVQANRQSDSIQFATNRRPRRRQGPRGRGHLSPGQGACCWASTARLNQAKVTELTTQEATTSPARWTGRGWPRRMCRGSFFGTFSYALNGKAQGFTSFEIQHVGSFPNGFPNTPGKAGMVSPLYGHTDRYT